MSKSSLRMMGGLMLAIAMLAAAAAGLTLGLRFSVVTLALLILAIAIIFTAGFWGGSSRLVVAFQLLVTLAFVQISYLLGSLLAAHLPAQAKTRSDRVQVRPGYQRAR